MGYPAGFSGRPEFPWYFHIGRVDLFLMSMSSDEIGPLDSPKAAVLVPPRTRLRSLIRKVFVGPHGLRAGWKVLLFFVILFALGFCLRPLGKLSGKIDPKLPVPPGPMLFREFLRSHRACHDRHHGQVHRSQTLGILWYAAPQCISLHFLDWSGERNRHTSVAVGNHAPLRMVRLRHNTTP